MLHPEGFIQEPPSSIKVIDSERKNNRHQNQNSFFDYLAPEPSQGPHGTPSILTQPEWREYIGTFTPEMRELQSRLSTAATVDVKLPDGKIPERKEVLNRSFCATAPPRFDLDKSINEMDENGKDAKIDAKTSRDLTEGLSKAIHKQMSLFDESKVNKILKVLMSQYIINENRTLPKYVIQNELTRYKGCMVPYTVIYIWYYNIQPQKFLYLRV